MKPNIEDREVLSIALNILESSPVGEIDFDPDEVIAGFFEEYKEHFEDRDFSLKYLSSNKVEQYFAAVRIALAHLKKIRDYYTRLSRMELEAKSDS